LFDYPDLFREAADTLSEEGLYHEALRFYEPLQQVKDYTDTSFFAAMAKCYRAVGLVTEAEDCYQTIIEHDEENVDARVQLAKMFEELGMPEQAFTYATEVMLLGRQHMDPSKKVRIATGAAVTEADSTTPTMLSHRTSRPGARKLKTNLSITDKVDLERTRNDTIRILHLHFLELREAMLAGNNDSTLQWLDAARGLILDFKSNKIFFPWDKYIKFQGYSKEARNITFKPRTSEAIDEMEAMADRLQNFLGMDNSMFAYEGKFINAIQVSRTRRLCQRLHLFLRITGASPSRCGWTSFFSMPSISLEVVTSRELMRLLLLPQRPASFITINSSCT
jgi:general transcription factor 3C polypeptide 3 (transcription factor C subunit 4)